ncbi:putative signal transducing protein [Halalkalibaculum sp. DA3122]|uniref:putative signal transducing protein n=1 Tax=unclassified Halalkalibaculum TaxID=2964617 RepID=UPI003754E3D8
MFDGPKPSDINNWVCILERSTEYEVELVKGYLSNRNIPSNILSKRDSAYSLTVGETALVYLYVPQEYEEEAREALEELDEQDFEDLDDSSS